MGIFDFFRKLAQGKNRQNSGKEKIIFSELGSWIENKITDIEKKEEEIF